MASVDLNVDTILSPRIKTRGQGHRPSMQLCFKRFVLSKERTLVHKVCPLHFYDKRIFWKEKNIFAYYLFVDQFCFTEESILILFQ